MTNSTLVSLSIPPSSSIQANHKVLHQVQLTPLPLTNYYLYYYLRGFSCLDSSFFQFKNVPTPLCLSRDKIKGQSGKNATLTLTKTLPKKQDYSPIIFQIILSIYKWEMICLQHFYNIFTTNLKWQVVIGYYCQGKKVILGLVSNLNQ